ncbi:MAG: nucleotide sugar dehydrogenase [Actinobacteria bacterium]|nr:MAG: nucleotide sugar dehydrogenase [Actinomycetota bacterium]
MNDRKPAIGIFGAGWVGLVTGACFADLGHEVVVRDVVPARIELLASGELPFHEPGLAELIERNRNRLTFTLETSELKSVADIFFSCVDTPQTPSGDADLTAVWSVIDDLGDPGEAILVMKSTVPVGTGERIRAALDLRGLEKVGYVSNPEFLAEGRAVEDFMSPDRIVIGSFAEEHGDRIETLYDGFDAPVVRTTVPSAEMIKLAANAFLATRISFINEIANVSEAVGADVEDVARGMGLDKRIGTSYLRPGIGYGGSCLVGSESVLARRGAQTWLTSLEQLFRGLAGDESAEVLIPQDLEVLSWSPRTHEHHFMPVGAVTRRWYEGEILEVRTKMGRRVLCTPDHPFVVAPHASALITKEASDLSEDDWLPLVHSGPPAPHAVRTTLDLLEDFESCGLEDADVIVRRDRSELAAIGARGIRSNLPESSPTRAWDIIRSGALRLREHTALGLQTKRIAPTGYKRDSRGTSLVRVTSTTGVPFRGYVYSLEVPETETFVTTGGLVVHNCFPKDVSFLKLLAGNSGYHFQLVSAVIEVNDLQKRRVVNKLKERLGSLRGKKVALLGLAFKPNTDDMREAPSVVLASRLQAEGAEVRGWDPLVRSHPSLDGVTIEQTVLDAVRGADAAVIVTEWPELEGLPTLEVREAMRTPLLVDGRNLLEPEAVRAAGFQYEGIGRT